MCKSFVEGNTSKNCNFPDRGRFRNPSMPKNSQTKEQEAEDCQPRKQTRKQFKSFRFLLASILVFSPTEFCKSQPISSKNSLVEETCRTKMNTNSLSLLGKKNKERKKFHDHAIMVKTKPKINMFRKSHLNANSCLIDLARKCTDCHAYFLS